MMQFSWDNNIRNSEDSLYPKNMVDLTVDGEDTCNGTDMNGNLTCNEKGSLIS